MGWVNAAVAIGGALIGSQASKSAAGKQSDAANRATDIQWDMYDQTRTDNLPFMQSGYAANDLINMLMGVAPTSGAATPQSLSAPKLSDYSALRKSLLPKYTSQQQVGMGDNLDVASVIDEAALQKAIEQQMAKEQQAYQQFQSQQAAAKAGQGTPGSTNPLYGSLLKPFTGADLENDPGYQFQLGQGIQAGDRSAAAGGGLYSGNRMKDLMRFGQGLASTSFGDAWNRNEQGKGNMLNALLGIRGGGQAAISQVGSSGANAANNASSNAIGLGNALAGNALNQGNIWGNAVNGLSAYAGRPSSPGSSISNGTLWNANMSSDPVGALGASQGWWASSDIRLKTNVRLVGKTARGYNRYAWDWIDGSGSAEGVIAQEVQAIDPSAVTADADGFLMVSYSKV